MDHQGLKVYKVHVNDDHGFTLTYFTARSKFVKIAHCSSDQQSGERLHDRWSSGFLRALEFKVRYFGNVLTDRNMI